MSSRRAESASEPDDDLDVPRRRLRWVYRITLGVLAALLLYGGITFVQVWQASGRDDTSAAEAIVVLGAAQYDGEPSPALEQRLRHALELYRQDRAPMIVVTGGRQTGDRFTEATASYNWLRDRGVPDDAILKEVQGHNTWESLAAVSRFLRPRDVSDVILVSSPAHSLRLDLVAREVGLHPHVSPTGGGVSFRSLSRETAAVSLGRVVGFRRLTRLAG